MSFTQLNFWLGILYCKSLKTKGFSRKTEAFCLIGGGETHSELLTPINCFFSSIGKICYYIGKICYYLEHLRKLGHINDQTIYPRSILPDGDDHTTSVNPFTGFRGRARKGTVAATLNNIALLDRLFLSNANQEQIAGVKKAVIELMPSLKAIGVFDFFSPIEWINLEHLGRTYVALLYLKYYPDEINKEIVDKLKKIYQTTQNPFFQSELQSLCKK